MRILDYGCGSGGHARQLKSLGYEIFGCDPYGSRSPVKNDRRHLPFRDKTFDVVLSLSVLEHCFEIDDYYREASRVLKPGGILWATFPQRWVPYDTHAKRWFRHWFFPRWYRPEYMNWKGKRYHIRIARKYFDLVEDQTENRLLQGTSQFNEKRLHHRLRKFIDILSRYKQFRRFISNFSSVDLWAYKLQH